MDRDKSISLLKALTLESGVSGYEGKVADLIDSYMAPLGAICEKDGIGNLVYTFKGNGKGKTVSYVAHMDEVGFMVFDILETGYIRFLPIGGWLSVSLPSSPVEVITRSGKKVSGVIGQLSPHYMKKGAPLQVPEIDDLFIDIGARNKQEAMEVFGVQKGDIIVPVTEFIYKKESGFVYSKAFDDRAGCALLIDAAIEYSKKKDSDNTLVFAFTVQEEVGTRGGQVLASYLESDYCFVLEGAPADDMPSAPAPHYTLLDKGAHIRIFDPTHIGSFSLLEKVRAMAKDNGIVIQEAIRKGGGTDAVQLSKSNRGTQTIVCGLPVRYAHSHTSGISMFDYEEMLKVMIASFKMI